MTDIICTNEVALESMREGILNLSAYAESIVPLVEKRLIKSVKRGSVITALSRMSAGISHVAPLRSPIHIEDLSIKSPLCELTYERSAEIIQNISQQSFQYRGKGFFTVTMGIGEVTMIIPQGLKEQIMKQFKSNPKGQYDNLCAITTRFSENEYIEVPNMIYTMVAVLAGRRINLIEIVSTFTEISFIVRQKDLKNTIDVMKDNFLI